MLGGVSSLYFILKWGLAKDNHYSWKSRDILIYCNISSWEALCIFCVFIPLTLNPDPQLLSGWRNLLTFLLLVHQLVTLNCFLSKFKDPSKLSTAGQWIMYSVCASLEAGLGHVTVLSQFLLVNHCGGFVPARLETYLKWQLSWHHALELASVNFPPKERKACLGHSLWYNLIDKISMPSIW